MASDFDHIVIGAGISGLGAAHFSARRGLNTLVLEAAPRIGGCIDSHQFPGLGGFWAEAGSHTCFNSYGNLLSILDDLGLTPQVRGKVKVGYRLWRRGERTAVTAALHPLEALISLPRLFTTPKAGRSVSDYYGRVLGARNYRDLLRHAFQAVICQPADDYPAEALFRRKPRRKDVIKAFTFDRGLSTICEAIAGQPLMQVRTDQPVQAIARDGGGFRVSIDGAEPLSCKAITLAVPPDQAARLIPEGFEGARSVAASIGVAEIETLVLAFRASDLVLPPSPGSSRWTTPSTPRSRETFCRIPDTVPVPSISAPGPSHPRSRSSGPAPPWGRCRSGSRPRLGWGIGCPPCASATGP